MFIKLKDKEIILILLISLTHASTPMSYLPLVLKKNPSITMKDSLAFGIQVQKKGNFGMIRKSRKEGRMKKKGKKIKMTIF